MKRLIETYQTYKHSSSGMRGSMNTNSCGGHTLESIWQSTRQGRTTHRTNISWQDHHILSSYFQHMIPDLGTSTWVFYQICQSRNQGQITIKLLVV